MHEDVVQCAHLDPNAAGRFKFLDVGRSAMVACCTGVLYLGLRRTPAIPRVGRPPHWRRRPFCWIVGRDHRPRIVAAILHTTSAHANA